MDMVISDLARQYALQTESDATDTFLAAATRRVDDDRDRGPTGGQVAAAFWGAVGPGVSGTRCRPAVIAVAAPHMLGLVGPLFAPVNPQNAQSHRVQGGRFRAGRGGADLRHPGRTSAGRLADNRSSCCRPQPPRCTRTASAALQVVEPSVLGVQVSYAGYFTPLVIDGDRHRRRSSRRHERPDGRPEPGSARARPGMGGGQRRRRPEPQADRIGGRPRRPSTSAHMRGSTSSQPTRAMCGRPTNADRVGEAGGVGRLMYATIAELGAVLRIERPTQLQLEAMERCLVAAAEEIDWELEYTEEAPAPTPPPALVVAVNLDRAVEHWRQGQSPFGVLGIGVETPIVTARDSWYRHAAETRVVEGA